MAVIADKIAGFIRDSESARFDDLAAELLAYQTEHADGLHNHAEVQRSLVELAVDKTFPRFCLVDLDQPPMLSLMAAEDEATNYALSRWGAEDSLVAVSRDRIKAKEARGFMASRQRDGRPVVILATVPTLVQLVDSLERLGLRFRLPAGSVVVDRGQEPSEVETSESDSGELVDRVELALGIPAARVVRELGLAETITPLYTSNLIGGSADRFALPHWVQARILDPVSLEELPAGQTGRVSLFDLATVSSPARVLTQLEGVVEHDGVRLAAL